MALGPPSRVDTEYDIVSLGELGATDIANGVAPGSITLHFDTGISNGAGADFVVFENAFESSWVAGMVFMELAYVEVSSDGINFVRFPSISTNGSRPDDYAYWTSDLQAQIYGARDPTNVHNLAGKHVNVEDENWGTPFDLSDLINESLVIDGTVDLDNISYVRIVDIPGSGDFKDSQGNSIYDGWTTTGSGGFDLSGVGVIYAAIPEPACAAILSLMALVCAVRRRR